MKPIINHEVVGGLASRHLVYENRDPTGGYFVATLSDVGCEPSEYRRCRNLEEALSRAGIVEYVEGVQQYYDGRPDARREGS